MEKAVQHSDLFVWRCYGLVVILCVTSADTCATPSPPACPLLTHAPSPSFIFLAGPSRVLRAGEAQRALSPPTHFQPRGSYCTPPASTTLPSLTFFSPPYSTLSPSPSRQFGPVVQVQAIKARGFGFVTFKNEEGVNACLQVREVAKNRWTRKYSSTVCGSCFAIRFAHCTFKLHSLHSIVGKHPLTTCSALAQMRWHNINGHSLDVKRAKFNALVNNKVRIHPRRGACRDTSPFRFVRKTT